MQPKTTRFLMWTNNSEEVFRTQVLMVFFLSKYMKKRHITKNKNKYGNTKWKRESRFLLNYSMYGESKTFGLSLEYLPKKMNA